MRFHRFSSVFRYTLGAGTAVLFASLILATAPMPIAPPPRAVAVMSPPSVASRRSGGLQAGIAGLPISSGQPRRAANSPFVAPKSPMQNPKLVETYGQLPLSFEINQGQTDSQVRFLSRGHGYTLFLTGDEAVLSLRSQKSGIRSQQPASRNSKLENRNSFLPESLLPRPTEYGLRAIDNRQSAINNSSNKAPTVLRMTLVGANANAKVTGLDPLPGKSNYFLGNDPKKWRTNVSNYAKVKYENIYPGIDLVYYGKESGGRNQEPEVRSHKSGGTSQESGGSSTPRESGSQLEYDFVVFPGADPAAITLAVETGNSKLETGNSKIENGQASSPSPGGVRIDANGDLVISTDAGEVRFRKPLVYQPQSTVGSRQSAVTTDNGPRTTDAAPAPNPKSKIANPKFVEGSYKLIAKNQVAIELAPYDRTLPLIIDPVLAYSARFSLGGSTVPTSMAVDASGNVYLAGATSSTEFPATSGAFQTACTPDIQQRDSCQDAFVVKLNAEGSALVYATFLGGSRRDGSVGVAVDASGSAYVAGTTSSVDFPTTPGSFQPSCALYGQSCYDDAFVTKLSPDGSSLVYSTYLGGIGNDSAAGVALDASGNAYVAGSTESGDFPTVNALQPTRGWAPDGFLTKLNAAGTELIYSTYLGGNDPDTVNAIAVDAQGNAYVTGVSSAGYETVWACDPQWPMCPYPCNIGIDPWCYPNYPTDVPLDAHFPTTAGALQEACSANCGFLAKISADGSEFLYSTYLGNNGAAAVAVDHAGNAYAVGRSLSPGNYLELYPGALAWKLNPAGSALVYSVTLASRQVDATAQSLAVDADGNAYVAGTIYSRELPTVNPVQPTLRGPEVCSGDRTPCPDAFVTKLNPEGSAVLFSTYFGGEGKDSPTAMAIDGSGNIYLAGTTESYDFPTTSGTLTGLPPGYAFVAKIAPEDAPGVAVTPVALRLPAEIDPSLPYQPTVTVRNMGSAPLTITDIAATDGFAASSVDCLATLSPGAACTITVGYDSQAPWAQLTGTLAITDNAPDSPQLVPLSGNPSPGSFPTLLPSTLDFGQQVVAGPGPDLTLTLSAPQQEGMTIYAIRTGGEFSGGSLDCPFAPSTLAAGASCPIRVHFSPTVRGPHAGTLTVTHDKSYFPLSAALQGTGLQGAVTISPTLLAFEGQPVGSTSPPKTVTVTNSGDGPVGLAPIYISRGPFAQSNNCPSTLAPAANCAIGVTFTPSQSGSQSGELSASWNVDLYGTTESAPVAEVTPETLAFADQALGTTSPAQTVTLTNVGHAQLAFGYISVNGDFSVAHNCGPSIAPAASCTISVTFTPTGVGNRSGGLTFFSTDGYPSGVYVQAIGLGPLIGHSPSSLNFGSQAVGTTSPPHILTLSNTGNAPLDISGIAASGDFGIAQSCVSPLLPEAYCSVPVTFSPTVQGAATGAITISYNAPGSPHTVVLSGIGLGAVVTLSTTSLDFGNQPLGTTSAPRLVNLSNSGNAPLTISSITTSGTYAQSNNCVSPLAPGASCTISVTFTPPATVAGGQSGTLTIADDASDSPHVVNLSGTGIGPVVSLSSNTLSFAGQIVGTTSAAQALTLSNSGNAPLGISSITASGDYALTHNCVSPLAAEASCTLSVTFTPTVGGGRGGTLIITDNAAGSPRTVSLSGIGQDFSLGAFTTARAVSPGMTARFDLLLMPQGGFSQTVSLACSGAPTGATCSVRPSSVTPNGVNNVSVALEVVTTAPAASAPRDGGGRRSLPPGGWPVATTLALLGALALLASLASVAAVSHRRPMRAPASPVRTPALQWVPLAVAVMLLALWTACGGGGGLYVRSGGTPAGTYTLTITATTSNLSHNTTVKLTVR